MTVEPLTPAQVAALAELDAELSAGDRANRITRTAAQGGVGFALITVLSWAAALADLDLDPGAGTDLPGIVASAFTALGAAAVSWWMNRKPKPPG